MTWLRRCDCTQTPAAHNVRAGAQRTTPGDRFHVTPQAFVPRCASQPQRAWSQAVRDPGDQRAECAADPRGSPGVSARARAVAIPGTPAGRRRASSQRAPEGLPPGAGSAQSARCGRGLSPSTARHRA